MRGWDCDKQSNEGAVYTVTIIYVHEGAGNFLCDKQSSEGAVYMVTITCDYYVYMRGWGISFFDLEKSNSGITNTQFSVVWDFPQYSSGGFPLFTCSWAPPSPSPAPRISSSALRPNDTVHTDLI